MARIMKRKRVPILSEGDEFDEDDFVDIPVIFELSFIGSGGQEFRYRFRNDSSNKLRTVLRHKVGHAEGEFGPDIDVSYDKYINAERIQTMAFPNSVETIDFMGKPVLYNQAWRTDKKLKNRDPAPKTPQGEDDPHHLKVHYVRFYRDNDLDSSSWVDVEYIDMLSLNATNAQEYIYRIKHLTAEDYATMAGDDDFGQVVDDDDDPYLPIIGFCDPSLELLDVEFTEDELDPEASGKPVDVRLDPFQNIVNLGGSRKGVWVLFSDWGYISASLDGINWSAPVLGPFNAGPGVGGTYANGCWVMLGFYYGDQTFSYSVAIMSVDGFNWTECARCPPDDPSGLFTHVDYSYQTNKFTIHRGNEGTPGNDAIVPSIVDNPNPPDPDYDPATNPHAKFGFIANRLDINSPLFPVGQGYWFGIGDGTTFVNDVAYPSGDVGVSTTTDRGETFQDIGLLPIDKTCSGPWGWDTMIFEQPGVRLKNDPETNAAPAVSAPAASTPTIPVATFVFRNRFPPVHWEVHYFTQAYDVSVHSGSGIHVTRFGPPNPGEPTYDNATTEMINEIKNVNSVFWARDYSPSPPGDNYVEFDAGSNLCYSTGDGSDRPNDGMIAQVLDGFLFALAHPELFVVGELAPEGQKYEFPNISGFYPV